MLLNRGTRLSDLWLPVRINGDIALFKGLMKEMLAEEDRRPGEILDWNFIRQYTVGYDELAASLRATSWEDILAIALSPGG
jgi:anaerobic selenocysteine-containing dehydrogenase